jgi:hypothetical protein
MHASPAVTISVLLFCSLLAHCGGVSESRNEESAGSGASGGTGGTGGASAGTGSAGRDPSDVCPRDPPYGTLPLDIYCDYFRCSATLDEAVASSQSFCNGNTTGDTLRQGCGFSALGRDGNLGGGWQVFDASGALVGASYLDDIPTGPCQVSSYEAGLEFPDCPEAVRCMTCQPLDGAPVCRFDCDCANTEPVLDPCHSFESCQCYCAQLESTIGR